MRAMLLAVLLAPSVALGQMYKCVDERGVTSYADKPCAGAKGAKVDIQGAPPISGKLQAPSQDLGREEADFRRRQIAREQEADKERTALLRRCATLRQEQGRVSTFRRPVQVDAKGERSVMDEQAREKRLAELRDQLRGCP